MFAGAARRLIIVDDVDDFADDPNPLEKRSGDRHSTAFGRGLDPKTKWAPIEGSCRHGGHPQQTAS